MGLFDDISKNTPIVNPARFGGGPAMQYEIQAEMALRQMEDLIEKDPIGAAKAWIGRAHLMKYGFLRPNAEKDAGIKLNTPAAIGEGYPAHYEIGDAMNESREIVHQLLAIEFADQFEENLEPMTPDEYLLGGDASPYTLDAIRATWDHLDDMAEMRDPFTTTKRPKALIERINHEDGVIERMDYGTGEVTSEKIPDMKEFKPEKNG